MINDLCQEIHAWAHTKGFYDHACGNNPCQHKSGSTTSALMLVVTELAEACEALRKGDDENFREEIADTAIRLFDLAAANGIDLEAEIEKKMAVNVRRPHMHGKKF